jgi:hypothetical protein
VSIVLAADFTEYIRSELGSLDERMITQAQNAAEQVVQQYCQRTFEIASVTASARLYIPKNSDLIRIHDCTSVTSITENGTTLASTSYQLEPLNGLSATGTVVPYTQARRVYSAWLNYSDTASVSVTATWGWTAVPPAVIEAIKQVGKDMIQMRDTKFGYQLGEFGAILAGRNWAALNALAPFRRSEAFGVA